MLLHTHVVYFMYIYVAAVMGMCECETIDANFKI